MKTIKLNGEKRTDLGKKNSKQLRKNGIVPCSLYGGKKENINFTLAEKDLKDLVYSPYSHIVEITMDGKVHQCILKDIQFHPVSDDILHIDFLNIDEKNPVTIDIPVKITGHSEGVKQGGKLQVVNKKLKVSALAKHLPDTIEIDITDLKIGKTISVSDLSLKNINILTPKDSVICSVKVTRAAVNVEETAGTEAEQPKAESEKK